MSVWTRRRRRLAAPLLAAAAAVLVGCGGDDDAGTTTATRTGTTATAAAEPGVAEPQIDQDFPDPDVLRVGATYLAFATNSQAANVQVARSSDLRTWQVLDTDALPKLPAWATTGRTWAPDVSQVAPGRFVLYFTAHSIDPDVQCIGVAVGTRPEGPFVSRPPKPLVCPAAEGGAIDPASFVDADGRRYLLWKNDGNCCGKDTWLHLQPVSADGTRTTGPARRLVKEDLDWEGNLVEAPTLVRHAARYVLLYSANDYSGENYATGYAVAARLAGPYRKSPTPLLTTEGLDERVTGPGGQDLFADAQGREHIAFHGWDPAGVYRGMYVADVRWSGDKPVVTLPGG